MDHDQRQSSPLLVDLRSLRAGDKGRHKRTRWQIKQQVGFLRWAAFPSEKEREALKTPEVVQVSGKDATRFLGHRADWEPGGE